MSPLYEKKKKNENLIILHDINETEMFVWQK